MYGLFKKIIITILDSASVVHFVVKNNFDGYTLRLDMRGQIKK